MMETDSITVQANVAAPIEKVWKTWTKPEHIMHWCSASDDWHVPTANNDARVGGKFMTRMEAKDGSMGFDFEGVYSKVIPHKEIAYEMADGRKVSVAFEDHGDSTLVIETFDPETVNP